MPRTRESSAIDKYPENEALKFEIQKYIINLFSRVVYPFLGKHLKKQNKSSWNTIGADSTEG